MLARVTRVGDAEALGLAPTSFSHGWADDVQAVADGGAAEREQPVAEAVPRGPARFGDGEGDEPPPPVPAPPRGVLGVGEAGALDWLPTSAMPAGWRRSGRAVRCPRG